PGGGDGIELEPLLRRVHAARRADPDHELVRGLELLPTALVAQVAVVLLVAAVELDQALVLERQRAGDRVGQAFDQRAAQAAAAGLDVFDGRMAHGGQASIFERPRPLAREGRDGSEAEAVVPIRPSGTFPRKWG